VAKWPGMPVRVESGLGKHDKCGRAKKYESKSIYSRIIR